MQIEEFLRSLPLPKRYYGETFNICEKLNNEKTKYQKGLAACIADEKANPMSKAINKAIRYAERKSEKVFRLLNSTLRQYENADLKAAQENFEQLMIVIKEDLFYATLFEEIKLSTEKGTFRIRIRRSRANRFFRIRAVKAQDTRIENNAYELFHIPVTKRQFISNERFSLSGFPTLYLATALPLAWQECGYPEKYYWSEFRCSELLGTDESADNPLGKMRLLALYSPHEIAIWGMSLKYNEPELWIAVIRRYLAIYPLVLACSFVNANGGTPFKQEYIIPQMLMQWVYRHKRKCSGISYFSCMDDSTIPDKWNAYNIALPAVKPYDENGYSSKLQELFDWNKPRYYIAPTTNLQVSADDRKILNAFAEQELSASKLPFAPRKWNDLYWKMVKVAMQLRTILEFSNGANLKMVLAVLDAINEEHKAILYRLPELSEQAEMPQCADEKTRLRMEQEMAAAHSELVRAVNWFIDNTTGGNGIGWIIEKYRELTWNGFPERSMICVASIDKGAAIPILRLLKEQHLLCCYRQLEGDDSSLQWLQEVAKSEEQDITMFWNPDAREQQKSSDWFREYIKSIKSPILVQLNDVNIFTPEGTKQVVFLGFGEDIKKIAENIRKKNI